MACMRLHNYCLDRGIAMPDQEIANGLNEEAEEEIELPGAHVNRPNADVNRRRVVNLLRQ